MVRGYFSVVFDIAKVYTEVSRKHIMPGMNLVDRLGLTDPADPDYANELEREKVALRDYSSKAMVEIQELAGRVSIVFTLPYLVANTLAIETI